LQPPDAGVDEGAHARATVPQAGAVIVAVPPMVAHEPPDGAGADTVTATAGTSVKVCVHDVDSVSVPYGGVAHELSR
jgi:hypothetical protein